MKVGPPQKRRSWWPAYVPDHATVQKAMNADGWSPTAKLVVLMLTSAATFALICLVLGAVGATPLAPVFTWLIGLV